MSPSRSCHFASRLQLVTRHDAASKQGSAADGAIEASIGDVLSSSLALASEVDGLLARKPCADDDSSLPPPPLDLDSGAKRELQSVPAVRTRSHLTQSVLCAVAAQIRAGSVSVVRSRGVSGADRRPRGSGAGLSRLPADQLSRRDRRRRHVQRGRVGDAPRRSPLLVPHQPDVGATRRPFARRIVAESVYAGRLVACVFARFRVFDACLCARQVLPIPLGRKSRSKPGASCLWAEAKIEYPHQVEFSLLMRRLAQHFTASAFSLQHSRRFNATKIIVLGAMNAMLDAVLRVDTRGEDGTGFASPVSLYMAGLADDDGAPGGQAVCFLAFAFLLFRSTMIDLMYCTFAHLIGSSARCWRRVVCHSMRNARDLSAGTERGARRRARLLSGAGRVA